jgi:hypothetical protein
VSEGKKILYIVVFLLLILFWQCYHANAKTSAQQQQSELGSLVLTENPNMYYVGEIIEGDVIGSGNNVSISLRIHPLGTYLLFDENLVFCGREAIPKLLTDQEHLKDGWVAFTYRRQASRLVEGVACHTLISADRLEQP